MGIKVTNNAYGTLSASITSSATTIALATGQGARFPSLSAGDYFYGTLIDTSNNVEIVKVTARSTDSMTVVRGQDNTTARAYSTNDRFELRPTAALFNDFTDRLAEKLSLSGGAMTGAISVGQFTYGGNTGEARIGRASDRSVGVLTLQLGGTSNQKFEIVDKDWSDVLFSVDELGRVFSSLQPAFEVHGSGATVNAGSYTTYSYSSTYVNIGGHMNAGTGVFTAPVAGLYQFHGRVEFSGSPGSSFGSAYIYKNGTEIVQFLEYGNYYSGPSFTVLMSLAANDQITLRSFGNNAISGTTYAHRFGGYLIG